MPVPIQDRIKGGIEKVFRAILGPRIDYYGTYQCVVVQQNADGSLDLKPDDPRVPGMQGIPINWGLPGVTATVSPGARADVVFLSADPSKPRATLWENAALITLNVNSSSQVNVVCPAIALGNGPNTQAVRFSDLKSLLDAQAHIGNLGY